MIQGRPLSQVALPAPRRMLQGSELRLTLRGQAGLTTNGSGVVGTVIAFDPSSTMTSFFGSSTQFVEWTSIKALYSLVKCLGFEVYLTPNYLDDTKGDSFPPLAIGSSLDSVLVSPATYSAVVDNADSHLWNPLTDKSGVGSFHSVKIPNKGNSLPYASTALPNPGSSTGGVIGGCPGFIQLFLNGWPINTTICSVLYVGHYMFRSRI